MKILAFVDVHLDEYALHELKSLSRKADLLVCAGDLSNLGSGLNEVLCFLSSLKKELLIIPGNNEFPVVLNELCKKYGFVFLNLRKIERNGFVFAGIGGGLTSSFNSPFELSENELSIGLSKFKGLKNLVLISHVPPYGLLGEVNGRNIGSKSLLKFIEEEQPLLCVCGHAHEQAGNELFIHKTRVVNPGKHGMIIELK